MMKIEPARLLLWLVLLLSFGIAVAGCQSAEQLGFWRDRVSHGDEQVVAQQQVIDELEAELAALPEDSPRRADLEAELADAKAKQERLKRWREDSQRNLEREAKKPVGDPNSLTPPPGVPYGETIAMVAAGAFAVWGAWEKFNSNRRKQVNEELRRAVEQREGAIEEIVESVDKAYPIKTTEQKLVMNSVQDKSTRKIVAAIRADNPVPEAAAVVVPATNGNGGTGSPTTTTVHSHG